MGKARLGSCNAEPHNKLTRRDVLFLILKARHNILFSTVKMTEIHRQATQLATTANPGTGVSADKSKIRSLQDTPNPSLRTLKRPHEKQRLGPQLPVNVDRLSFLAPPVQKKIKVSGDLIQKCSPWGSYHRFMELEQAGPSTISHDREHFLVAIKEKKYNGGSTLEGLRLTSVHNVVNLVKIFHNEGIIYMAYECMEVSLRSLSSTSKGKLKHFEIAAVCKEVWLRHYTSFTSS